MRTIRRSSSLMDRLPDPVREFLSRRASEMVGLALLALMAAVALSLATWSVDDPSLNNATSGAVANWLGRPGAMVADLLMQLIGLGVIALLFPPLVWSLRLVRFHIFDRGALKLGLWIVAVAATAAVGSALPATPRWPLPTGMGGVIGDGLLFGTRNLAGIAGNAVGGLVGFLYAGIAILAVTAAAGFGFVSDEDPVLDEDEADESWSESEDRRDDEPGIAVILVGWLAHGAMALRGMILRRLPQPPRAATQGAGTPATGTGALAAAGRVRREPQFAEEARGGAGARPTVPPFAPAPLPPLRGPRAAPVDDAPFDLDDDEPLDLRDLNAPRVTAPAPGPKPGKRIQREAQPSLLDRDEFELPPLTYLSEPRKLPANAISTDALEQNATLLEGVLEDFGVRGEITQVRPGPVVTLYELEPAPGTKSSRVISLADDIARSMSAISARVAVIPGKNAIGIELPNAKRETVYLRELLASQDFESSKHKLALGLGKTIGGEPVIVDLAKMPHLLVAGTTGSGKSVAINTMILSLLYRLKPEQCRLIMVDPKMLELSVYDGIPHLLTPVVTDPKKAVVALKWAVREMEERYKKMSKLSVRNIDGFNARVVEAKAAGEVITRTVQTGFDRHSGEAVYEDEVMDLEPLPYIVVIVDEMADLMMVAGKEIEGTIQRLAQMARAAGIHVVLATQRPSVDVITGTIKANFPTRISFQVTSKIDSRTILGEMGAEQLLGQGDMLYMAGGGRSTRVHGPFVSDAEVEKVVAHLKTQGRPQYLDAVTCEEEEPAPEGEDGAVFDKGALAAAESEDPYDQAVAVVLRDKKASTSYIQRRLQIGYNRAASIMERMENEGIVGPANHAGKREILVETGRAREDED
ncbi:DNA translocase FtsK [Bosea sp. (in: a-proteobacteria)]|uniref:FtsK/SpoIIIE family DNA translocase n=1 Tax=Bosea sp. (in: a-proteobacteria) TaxID=1871050 RepID=UPI002B4849A3|nr:DNA translocase FtsK [Bosea sp. (in: a-proteobacteria)]WRH60726.1 MAG: DNA translocase FtsK [Bosea sp. (in: a-proteobacteria)]